MKLTFSLTPPLEVATAVDGRTSPSTLWSSIDKHPPFFPEDNKKKKK
jgi:hypothetical protein